MYFSDDIDEARELARAAFNLMAMHKVPATPANYAIWYAYQTDSNPDLCRDLDRLICSMTAITPAVSEEIFGRHFGFQSEAAAIRDTGQRISGAIDRILAELEAAGRDGGASGDSLASITKNLADSAREMARLSERLDDVLHAAMTDAMTGLANRKSFDLRLREAVASLWKSGGRLSLLLADIDRFKAFNDTYGHGTGDTALGALGRALKESVKGRDTPARYGGDEFAVILPDTTLDDALKTAEQIRARLASHELKDLKTGESYGPLTLSLGVAQYRLGEPIGELIQRADQALGRAKRAGRNRVAAEGASEPDFPLAG